VKILSNNSKSIILAANFYSSFTSSDMKLLDVGKVRSSIWLYPHTY